MRTVVTLAASVLMALVGGTVAYATGCGDTISTATTLTGDLDCSGYSGSSALTISNGASLDCDGYMVTGPNSGNHDGINMASDKATVINCHVTHFDVGVKMACNNCLVFNVTSGGNLKYGLSVPLSGDTRYVGNFVFASDFSDNGDAGVLISSGGGADQPNYFIGNSANANSVTGFYVNGGNAYLAGNTTYANGSQGTIVDNASNVTVSDQVSTGEGSYGLYIQGNSDTGSFKRVILSASGVYLARLDATHVPNSNVLDSICVFGDGTNPSVGFEFDHVNSGVDSVTNSAVAGAGSYSVEAINGTSGNSVIDLYTTQATHTQLLSSWTTLSTQSSAAPAYCLTH